MTIRDKILIIEDEPTIANFMRAILEARDYEVMIVQSGAMASTLIASHCPDLIILDLGLPDMDGMQLLKAVILTEPPAPPPKQLSGCLLLMAKSEPPEP